MQRGRVMWTSDGSARARRAGALRPRMSSRVGCLVGQADVRVVLGQQRGDHEIGDEPCESGQGPAALEDELSRYDHSLRFHSLMNPDCALAPGQWNSSRPDTRSMPSGLTSGIHGTCCMISLSMCCQARSAAAVLAVCSAVARAIWLSICGSQKPDGFMLKGSPGWYAAQLKSGSKNADPAG